MKNITNTLNKQEKNTSLHDIYLSSFVQYLTFSISYVYQGHWHIGDCD